MPLVKNWAGNVTYSTSEILRPSSVAEAQELIAGAEAIRPLGTRHSFSLVADSAGVLLSTESLNRVVEIGDETVTVEAGIRYGDLSSVLEEHGLALPNLASLPHVSVGGAIATGTHGSGAGNQSLSAATASLELVHADGSISRLSRGDGDFDGAVVSLGALGLVTCVSLDVIPAFVLRQYVFEQLPWSTVEADLDAILEGAYSVSLFTMWEEAAIGQVWVKTTEQLSPGSSYFGAVPARQPRHPVLGGHWQNCTEQLGAPGPSGERLPHFRLGFTPSNGEELQTEYVVARRHGADAIRELRRLAGAVSPFLLTSEIRTVAKDTLWLSPFSEQDGIAFHFTWKPLLDDVLTLLPQIESALEPFGVRPHWGSCSQRQRNTSKSSTRSCRSFGSFCRSSMAPASSATSSSRATSAEAASQRGDVGHPVRVGPVPSLLAAVERVDRRDVARRRARSRRARSSPASAPGVIDLGKTMSPRWRCQRRTTCAGVRPTRAAISPIVVVVEDRALRDRRPGLGSDAVARVGGADASLAKYGCTSIWLTAGTTPVSATMPVEVVGLEVGDADRAAPGRPGRLVSVRQVETKSPSYSVGRGQWIRNRSTLVEAEPPRDSSNARRASSGRWKPLLSLVVTRLVAGQPGRLERLADPCLVVVHLRRCRCAGSRPRGPGHRRRRSRRRDLEDAEAELRDGRAVVEGDVRNGAHANVAHRSPFLISCSAR